MKTLLEYIEAQQKEYKFRLKFATPVDSDMHKKLESALAKFEATKVSKPKKTIIQGRQLDFPDAGPGESYIVDAVFAYPTTREAVRDTAATALRISPSLLVVRSSEEPLETDRELTQPTGKALLTAEYEDLKAEDSVLTTIADITDDAFGSVPCNLGDATSEDPIYGDRW